MVEIIAIVLSSRVKLHNTCNTYLEAVFPKGGYRYLFGLVCAFTHLCVLLSSVLVLTHSFASVTAWAWYP